MSDIPEPPQNIKLYSYADDINTLTSHSNINTAQDNIQPYLKTLHDWTTQNHLILNPDKSISTLFTPDPAEYNTQLHLQINNITIPTVKNPKVLGITLDPKLNFSQHAQNTTQKAKATTNIIKALSGTNWGKNKETLVATYKTITRPIIEYGSTTWSPTISQTNIQQLQRIQNTALRIATGCTKDTNVQHLHDETQVLPLDTHLRLHASQLRQKSLDTTHPLNHLIHQPTPPRNMKTSIFQPNNDYTINIPLTTTNPTELQIKQNIKTIHTQIVHSHLSQRHPNKVINTQAPDISEKEQTLPRHTRRTLAQLRTNKSPFLISYKNKIDPTNYKSPNCPLCNQHPHDTKHLFQCTKIPTTLTPIDLWKNPIESAGLLATWEGALAAHH